MPTHYCISSPCWICHPEYAPKMTDNNYDIWNLYIEDHKIPENDISGLLENLLIEIFECGLDEDQHYRSLPDNLSVDDIRAERQKLPNDSLTAKLIDLMLKDFSIKK